MIDIWPLFYYLYLLVLNTKNMCTQEEVTDRVYSMGEMEKIAYWLQECVPNLKLRFEQTG